MRKLFLASFLLSTGSGDKCHRYTVYRLISVNKDDDETARKLFPKEFLSETKSTDWGHVTAQIKASQFAYRTWVRNQSGIKVHGVWVDMAVYHEITSDPINLWETYSRIPKESDNILTEFFNSSSDASPLEAGVQERLERDFKNWLDRRNGSVQCPTNVKS